MSKYKDAQGRHRTQGLFYETAPPEYRKKYDIPYTLKEHDWEARGTTYLALRQIYLSFRDPTGYTFAIETLGSWDHWKKLMNAPFFKDHYKAWSEELDLLLQTEGIAHLRQEVKGGGKSAASAAKWLADKGWASKDSKGRPSSKKIEQEAQRIYRTNEEVDEFLEHAQTVGGKH